MTGSLFGKLTCGWACPIGFWQDFLSMFANLGFVEKLKVSRPTNKELQDIGGFFLWGSVIITGFLAFKD